MPVTETLELDLSGALGSIGQLDTALSEVSSAFGSALEDALAPLENVQIGEVDASAVGEAVSGALEEASNTPVAVTADTSEAEVAIDALSEVTPVEVPVDADTSLGEASVADFEALAEGLAPLIPVDADISAAQAELDSFAALADATDISLNVETGDSAAQVDEVGTSLTDVGAAGTQASGGLEQAGSASTVLGAGMQAAQGGVGGLSTSIGTLLQKAGPTAGVVGGVAAAAAVLFTSAEKSAAGVERLNLVFGNFASSVQHINVGGLNGDLGELATQSGNSATSLRQATATIGQMAISSGVGREKAAAFAETIAALSLRATAMNPSLGEAGDVAGRLGIALAKGGPKAAAFGVSLTSLEINTRALQNTGKATAAELTTVEKAMAGAQLAAEKAGGSIGRDFNNGVQQSAVQLKSFEVQLKSLAAAIGAPLVEPLLAVFKSLEPVIRSVTDTFKSLAPVLEIVVQAGFVPVVALAKLLELSLRPLVAAFEALGPPIAFVADALSSGFSAALEATASAAASLGSAIGGALLGPLEAVGSALASFGADVLDVFSGLSSTGDAFVQAFQAVIGVAEEIGSAFADIGKVTIALAQAVGGPIIDALQSLAGAIEDVLAPIEKLVAIGESVVGFFGDAAPPAKTLSDVISQLSDSERVLYIATGQLPPILQAQANALHDNAGASNEAAGAHERHATAAQTNAGALAVMNNLVDATTAKLNEATSALGQQALAIAGQRAPWDAFAGALDGAISKLPTVGSLLQQAAADVEKLTGALDPALVTQHLGDIANTFTTFFDNVTAISNAGFQGVATALLQIGPEAGAPLAAMFQGASDQQRADLEGVINGISDSMFRIQVVLQAAADKAKVVAGFVGTDIGDAIVAGFGKTDFSQLNEIPKAAIEAVQSSVPALEAAFRAMGQSGVEAHTSALGAIKTDTFAIVDAMKDGVISKKEAMRIAFGTLASGSASEVGKELDKLPPEVRKKVEAAIGEVSSSDWKAPGERKGREGREGVKTGLTGVEADTAATFGRAIAAAVAEGTRGTGLMAEAGRALSHGFTNGITEGGVAAGAAGLALVTAVEAGTRNTGLMAGAGAALASAFTAAVQAAATLATAAGLALVTAVEAGTRNTGLMAASGLALTTAFVASIQAAAGLANMAGLALATAAAAGTRNTGLMAEAGNALGSALASSLQAQTGAANAAGLALVTAAAQGTRNTGLMAEAGNALGSAFVDAVRGHAGAANNAGGDLASGAASGARGSEGAMSSAGASAGSAFASGVRSQTGAAFSAGQALGAAAAAGAKSAGSPTEHLFTDLAHELGEAFATGLQDKIRTGQAAGVEFARSTADAFGAELERAIREQVDSAIATMNAQLTAANIAPVGGGSASLGNIDSQAIFAAVNADVASRLGAKDITPPAGMTLGSLNINVDARGATNPQAIATATGAEVEARIRGLIRAGR